MVAADPDDAGDVGEVGQVGVVVGREAAGGLGVVEAVADGDEGFRRVGGDEGCEAGERERAVPGGEELAPCRGGGAFFEVEVGDGHQREAGPDEGAGGVQEEVFVLEEVGGGGHAGWWGSGVGSGVIGGVGWGGAIGLGRAGCFPRRGGREAIWDLLG